MNLILLRALVGGVTGGYVAFIMICWFPQVPMWAAGIPVCLSAAIAAQLVNHYVK